MAKLTKVMIEALRTVPEHWGRPAWPRRGFASPKRTIEALRTRGLFEHRLIADPNPDRRFASTHISQIRLSTAGLSALQDTE